MTFEERSPGLECTQCKDSGFRVWAGAKLRGNRNCRRGGVGLKERTFQLFVPWHFFFFLFRKLGQSLLASHLFSDQLHVFASFFCRTCGCFFRHVPARAA